MRCILLACLIVLTLYLIFIKYATPLVSPISTVLPVFAETDHINTISETDHNNTISETDHNNTISETDHNNTIYENTVKCSTPKFYPQVHLLQYLTPSMNSSCKRLFKGDKKERRRIRKILKSWKPPTDKETMNSLTNCSLTKTDFLDNFYISETEKNFPLAFQMLLFYQQNFLLQHIRLLKYLYRPHNIYCIHVDKKSPKWWTDGLRQFTKCFNNIFISTKQVHIIYTSVSILDAHLSCLKDLVNVTTDWRYVITLNSPEIPLVTNKEMVDTLIKMNGTNIMSAGVDALNKKNKIPYKWIWHKQVRKESGAHLTTSQLGPIPYNLTVYKSASSVNSAMSRDFVKFIVTDKRALALRERLQYVHSAEEFFFVTLNYLKDAPGNRHTIKKGMTMPAVTTPIWQYHRKKSECLERHFVHNICIVSVSDLPYLKRLTNLWFFNKYRIDYDHVVMDCMEELLLKKHFKEYEVDCINDRY